MAHLTASCRSWIPVNRAAYHDGHNRRFYRFADRSDRDDDAELLTLVSDMPGAISFDLSQATNGTQAEVAFPRHLDRLVRNRRRPDADGRSFASRRLEKHPNSPIIVVPSDTAEDAGAVGLMRLQKPFAIASLRQAIGNITAVERIH